MPVQIPETLDEVWRLLLVAAGMACLAVGLDMMLRDRHVSSGAIVFVLSIPCLLAAYKWTWLKQRMNAHLVATMRTVTTDWRWLVPLCVVPILAMLYSPVVKQHGWPLANRNSERIADLQSQLNAKSEELARVRQELATLRHPDNSSHSPMAPKPASALSPEDVPVKFDILERARTRHANDFTNALNVGYPLQANWPNAIKSNRQDFLEQASYFRRAFLQASQALEDLRREEPRFEDISELLRQPYKTKLISTLDDFTQAIESLPADLPPDYESRLRPYSGALKLALDAVDKWKDEMTRSAAAKSQELSALQE